MIGTAGTAPKLSTSYTTAVYDPKDGRVVHLHHVIVFDGAKTIDRDQAETEAVALARRKGIDMQKLRALTVESGHQIPRGKVRVDVAGRKIVAVARPPIMGRTG